MSWFQLLAIYQEAALEDRRQRQEQEQRPTACPEDGEPLLTGPDGQLYCPYDGFRPR